MSDMVTVHAPLFLLTSTEDCWKCGKPQEVIALAACSLIDESEVIGNPGDYSDPIMLSDITSMPPAVLKLLTDRNPRYMERHSKTAGFSYYANTCVCGANFGDFYMHCEPGGAFFPESDDQAKAMIITQLPFTGSLQFECSYGIGNGDLIFRLAQRRDF